MKLSDYNDPKNSLVLFGLQEKFNFLNNLLKQNKFPQVLMLTGKKGIGKFTLINHFLNYFFDKESYDLKNFTINQHSQFYKQYLKNAFPNIIYFSGNDFKTISIEKIRDLKIQISQTTILNTNRYIILDDVDLFNKNSLNALLKIIEEPTSKNYFLLINNSANMILETIHSRALEIKLILDETTRLEIIESLIKINNLNVFVDYNHLNISPGNFLIFNSICSENQIEVNSDYIGNLNLLLNLYKKSKDFNYINMILFITDVHFFNQKIKNNQLTEKIIADKNYVVKNLNNFISYNLNQNSLINAINNKILNG